MSKDHLAARGLRARLRLCVGVVAAVAVALGSSLHDATVAAPLIQPGEYMESTDSACTLNFVYDGRGGAVYIGTAAHCVAEIGEDISLADGTVFGDVAAIGDPATTETDWALIKVRRRHINSVTPAVKGHPWHPTGVTTSSDTTVGDLVQQSGYGMGFDLTETTREERQSVLTYDDAELFTVLGASIFGDSGGPVVHIPTGRALGTVSRLCIGACEMEGPTVEGILAQAAEQGLRVKLRAVPQPATKAAS